jgi:hypothetical protein
MENADHLLLLAHVFAGLLIGFAHLVAALNTFNDINIILAPHRKRILRLALGADGPGNKTFTH